VVEHYRSRGALTTVDGRRTIDEVTDELIDAFSGAGTV
jgi:adenylate kinase family enzyme